MAASALIRSELAQKYEAILRKMCMVMIADAAARASLRKARQNGKPIRANHTMSLW